MVLLAIIISGCTNENDVTRGENINTEEIDVVAETNRLKIDLYNCMQQLSYTDGNVESEDVIKIRKEYKRIKDEAIEINKIIAIEEEENKKAGKMPKMPVIENVTISLMPETLENCNGIFRNSDVFMEPFIINISGIFIAEEDSKRFNDVSVFLEKFLTKNLYRNRYAEQNNMNDFVNSVNDRIEFARKEKDKNDEILKSAKKVVCLLDNVKDGEKYVFQTEFRVYNGTDDTVIINEIYANILLKNKNGAQKKYENILLNSHPISLKSHETMGFVPGVSKTDGMMPYDSFELINYIIK